MVVRKMKEKCKDAARMRREKERAEFLELSKLLPLPSSTTSQLDKASIIRLTSSYLRMRSAFPKGLGGNWGNERSSDAHSAATFCYSHHMQRANAPVQTQSGKPGSLNNQSSPRQQQQVKELGSLILQTLDGFAFALHKDGKIMYISETASVHLGLPQIDLTGSSVFEYIHPSDHNDLHELLSLSETDKAQLRASTSGVCELGRSFCMRMKCILPKRNAGLVNNGYKAIHCSGYLKCRLALATDSTGANFVSNQLRGEAGSSWDSYALVAVGHSLLPSASTEVKLNGNSFMFRANLDLKIYYIEAPVVKLLGFDQMEMIGHSLYQFVHVADLINLDTSHRSLLEKGQVVTKYYRLMRKTGGFVWIQSYASLVNNPRNTPKPQHVVSICLVLGENPSDDSCILRQPEEQIKGFFAKNGLNSADNLQSLEENQATMKLGEHTKLSRKDKEKQSSACKRIRKSKETNLRMGSGKKERAESESDQSQHQSTSGEIPLMMGCGNTSSYFLPERQQVHLQKCACLTNSHSALNNKSIGCTRRPSDDTCSIVSSVASTSVSSASSLSSSSHNNAEQFSGLYQTQTTNETGYTMGTNPAQMEHSIQSNHLSYQRHLNCLPDKLAAANELHLDPSYDDKIPQHSQRQLITCTDSTTQQMAPLRAELGGDGNIWLSPAMPNQPGDGINEETCKVVQANLLEECPNLSFSQSNYNQQHYFHSTSEWLPQPANTDHCPTILFDHHQTHHNQRQQLHPSLKGYECTDDGISGAYLYSNEQFNSYYHQDLPPHLNSAGPITYQRSFSINNGYSMSSI